MRKSWAQNHTKACHVEPSGLCKCPFEEPDEEYQVPSPTPTLCDVCGIELLHGMYPFCRGQAENHGSGWRQHIFPPCEVDLGKDGKVVISSVQDVRRMERESERRAANGEGQLLVWREFSQDRSNYDRNSLGENNQISPREFMNKKSRGQITTRRGGDWKR